MGAGVWSLPSRERGLKSPVGHGLRDAPVVAPFTGAWIEIVGRGCAPSRSSVAPFTGAWIEMTMSASWWMGWMSLPSRERGLKWQADRQGQGARQSLPSRERGLKSVRRGLRLPGLVSLPSRERGLKYSLSYRYGPYDLSLPSRERGLKWCGMAIMAILLLVAPFTGAWIEIIKGHIWIWDGAVAPFTGAWIEISSTPYLPAPAIVAPFTGAWIEMPRWEALKRP